MNVGTAAKGENHSMWGEDVFPKLSWWKRHKVESAHVMVVGCGALGNEVLKNLALFGVGHLLLVDHDHVEQSNLTRSVLFNADDARNCRAKVDAASRSLHAINPNVEVTVIKADVCTEVGLGLIRRMDVVVGCLDNRKARYMLNRLCMRAGVPWVDGGIKGLEGVAKVFVPGMNCYACTMEPGAWKELKRSMSCRDLIKQDLGAERVPTTPVVASVIGAVQAQEAMKLIHKEEIRQGALTSLCGKMFYYEGQHLTSRLIEHRGWDDDCPVHEKWDPITTHSTLTCRHTLAEAMELLGEHLGDCDIEIVLRNQAWVDYIEQKNDDSKVDVMLPESKVAQFLTDVKGMKLEEADGFYQHEFRILGADFPYGGMTLQQLGIPDMDVLHVRTGKGEHFVELACTDSAAQTEHNQERTKEQ
jgi:adenylyltransferase/sulfurtransferase